MRLVCYKIEQGEIKGLIKVFHGNIIIIWKCLWFTINMHAFICVPKKCQTQNKINESQTKSQHCTWLQFMKSISLNSGNKDAIHHHYYLAFPE